MFSVIIGFAKENKQFIHSFIGHPTPNLVHMYKSAKCNVDYLGVLKTGRAAESII